MIKSHDAPEPAGGARAPEKPSYSEILKSSALIGFSTLINLAIGVIRTKAMAVWLGPAAFGLMGLYGSIADLAQGVAGMGINATGVRQRGRRRRRHGTDRSCGRRPAADGRAARRARRRLAHRLFATSVDVHFLHRRFQIWQKRSLTGRRIAR
jgi:hypothetical protein